MFSTKFAPAKGLSSKTEASHFVKKFADYRSTPTPTPPTPYMQVYALPGLNECNSLPESCQIPEYVWKWNLWLWKWILSCVWERVGKFSQLSTIQYVGLCVFSLPISLVMIERIYIYFVLLLSSNRKYELLPIV